MARVMEKLKEEARRLLLSGRLQWLLVGLGVGLRLVAYLHNRSLWRDEALLASNIESRSYAGLLQPLENQQAAPVGFLMLERFVVQILGNSEYALRLVPLLAGITSLFLMRSVAKKAVALEAVPIALGFFAISERAVYYSSEVKQYSTDVAICLALVLAAIELRARTLQWQSAALFGLAGALAVWLSHPSVFVLAGIGTTLFLSCCWRREWSKARLILAAASLWAISFAVSYVAVLRETSHSSFLLTFWDDYGGFVPAAAAAPSQAWWFISAFVKAFENPAGFNWGVLAAFAFLLGCVSALYYRRSGLLMLAAPIPFVLLASALRTYPFLDRLLLFLVPSLLLLIAEGVHLAARKTVIVGVALAAALFVHPMINAAVNITGDHSREDIKPALAYVRRNWQEGDVLYVHYAVKRLFKYYAGRTGFEEDDYFKGAKKPDDPSEFLQDLDQLRRNRRVWVLFLVRNDRTAQERQSFLDQVSLLGERIDAFETTGISVFLYELSSGFRVSGSGFRHCESTSSPDRVTQNSGLRTRNPKLVTQNPEPETRDVIS